MTVFESILVMNKPVSLFEYEMMER